MQNFKQECLNINTLLKIEQYYDGKLYVKNNIYEENK